MVGSPSAAHTSPSIPKLRQVATPSPRRGFCQGLARLAGRVGRLVRRRATALRGAWLRARARAWVRAHPTELRLCLGSGAAPLPDWTNIDLGGDAELRLDLREALPFGDGSVQLIYSEHMIEHIERDEAQRLLAECRRVLRPDGVLRLATPDLQAVTADYLEDWQRQDWVHWPGHEHVDSAARMVNLAFHGWGHRFLYDEAELTRALRDAGFAHVRRQTLGESAHAPLARLETRADSSLVLEAWGAGADREACS